MNGNDKPLTGEQMVRLREKLLKKIVLLESEYSALIKLREHVKDIPNSHLLNLKLKILAQHLHSHYTELQTRTEGNE